MPMKKKRVSILDIAKEANVSYQSVSLVINNKDGVSDETRGRISEIIQRMGYQPSDIARSLVAGRTFTLGCISESLTDFALSEITENIKTEALSKGYFLITASAPNKEEARSLFDQFMRRRVDGLIVFDPSMDRRDQLLSNAVENGFPVVYVGAFPEKKNTSGIRPDDIQGGRSAANVLLEHGHRDIAVITGPLNEECASDRLKGFIEELNSNNCHISKERIETCDWLPQSGYQAMMNLLEKQLPITALFCQSDMIAIGAMRAIRERNLCIPEDISIIGFDDIPLSNYLEPPLTTIHQDFDEIGRHAARLLIEKIEDPAKEPEFIFVENTLVIRNSVSTLSKSV
jgi:DNA-binding LacI/PurR family transcriptional regulator